MERTKHYINNKWQYVNVDTDAIKRDVSALSELQMDQLLRGIIQKSEMSDPTVSSLFNKYSRSLTYVMMEINRLKSKYVSATNSNLKYKCMVEAGKVGTTTSFSDEIDEMTSYIWGTPQVQKHMPNLKVATAKQVLAFGKPTDDGYSSISVSKADSLRSYFPSNAIVGQHVVNAASKAKSEEEALKLVTSMLDDQEGSQIIVDDLVKSQPKMLGFGKGKSKFQKIELKNRTYIRKGRPTRINVSKAPFASLVQTINGMSSAFGTKKYGFGKISQSSYDGLPNLQGSVRDRHEQMTDLILDVKADVYLLQTRDVVKARAVYREIAKSRQKETFLVIYDGNHTDIDLMKETCVIVDRNVKEIKGSAVICVSAMSWQSVFSEKKTYYISWKSYKKGKGKDEELITSSHTNRMYDHANASVYNYYAYYGFVGAMSEEDTAVPSCKGRDGTVIFTNVRKGHNRSKMADIVYNIVHHALLYPWLDSPYMCKVGEKYYFPGVREFKTDYDFRREAKDDNFLSTHDDDDDLEIEDINAFYEELRDQYNGFDDDALADYHEKLDARREKQKAPAPKEKEEEDEEEEAELDDAQQFLEQFVVPEGADEED